MTPTMHLRFNKGRLQQKFDTSTFIDGKWIVTSEWKDVEQYKGDDNDLGS